MEVQFEAKCQQISTNEMRKMHIHNMVIIKKNIPVRQISYAFLVALCAIFSEFTIPHQQSIQKLIWSGFALYGILYLIRKEGKNAYAKNARRYVWIVCLPEIGLFGYTLVARLILGDNLGIVLQSFTSCAYIIVDILMAYALANKYKDKCIDFVYHLNIVSYIFTLVKMIHEHGVMNVYTNYLNPGAMLNSYIERNDVGTAVVLLLVYYLWQIATTKYYRQKKYFIRCILLFVIWILCSKRSAAVGLVIGILFAVFLEKKRYSDHTHICLSGLAIVAIMGFLAIIKFGFLEAFAQKHGIDSAGRVYVWSTFSNSYNLSPLYFGQGFQYLHKYMLFESTDGMVRGFGYLHNSLLQLYIELGFILFIVYFFYQIYYVSRKTKSLFGYRTALLYFCLYMASIAIYATDNVLTYPIYQLTLYTCIFSLGREEIKRRVFINVGSNYIKL